MLSSARFFVEVTGMYVSKAIKTLSNPNVLWLDSVDSSEALTEELDGYTY